MTASNLSRPAVFRLNIGIGKQTFQTMFGSEGPSTNAVGGSESDYDFTALDRIMPHPVYGKMYWVCVLNPSDETFQTLRPLLTEAFELSASRRKK